MANAQDLMAQMDAIFHPESIAVVGVPRGMKSGKIFLMGLLDQGFPGRILPVHPEAKEIDGLEAFPSISAISDVARGEGQLKSQRLFEGKMKTAAEKLVT